MLLIVLPSSGQITGITLPQEFVLLLPLHLLPPTHAVLEVTPLLHTQSKIPINQLSLMDQIQNPLNVPYNEYY